MVIAPKTRELKIVMVDKKRNQCFTQILKLHAPRTMNLTRKQENCFTKGQRMEASDQKANQNMMK